VADHPQGLVGGGSATPTIKPKNFLVWSYGVASQPPQPPHTYFKVFSIIILFYIFFKKLNNKILFLINKTRGSL
jgi:hypothetical protein